MWEEVRSALGLSCRAVTVTGKGHLGSVFAVTDLAVVTVGAAGVALAGLLESTGAFVPEVEVDRALASRWFGSSIHPVGWEVPSAWDPLSGDYRGADGWIRLHTNAPRHRQAALKVLGVAADRAAVTSRVGSWAVEELEVAIVAAGGAAATMRSAAEWAAHTQGAAVSAELLVDREPTGASDSRWRPRRVSSQPG